VRQGVHRLLENTRQERARRHHGTRAGRGALASTSRGNSMDTAATDGVPVVAAVGAVMRSSYSSR
jgi:hypothetical protein